MAFNYLQLSKSTKIYNSIMQSVDKVHFVRGVVGCGKTTDAIYNMAEWCARVCPETVDGVPLEARILVVRQDQSKIKSSILLDVHNFFGDAAVSRTTYDYPLVIDKMPYTTLVGGVKRTVLLSWYFLGVATAAEAQSKLRAMNMTALLVDEAQTFGSSFPITEGDMRIGRFPARRYDPDGNPILDGTGYEGQKLGIVLYNPPEEGHWIHKADENKNDEVRPPDWVFHAYPSPIKPVIDVDGKWVDFELNDEKDADFVKINGRGDGAFWLKQARNLLAQGARQRIRVDLMGEYGETYVGKPVFQSFNRDTHVLSANVVASPSTMTYIGYDHSGNNNGAVICQRSLTMGLVCLADVYADDTVSDEFMEYYLFPKLTELGLMDKSRMIFILDPADQRQNVEGAKIAELLIRKYKMPAGNVRKADKSVNPVTRRESLTKTLVGIEDRGMRISSKADILIQALAGKYAYAKIAHTDRWKNEAEKSHPWSDVADAMMYVTSFLHYGAMLDRAPSAPKQRPAYSRVI